MAEGSTQESFIFKSNHRSLEQGENPTSLYSTEIEEKSLHNEKPKILRSSEGGAYMNLRKKKFNCKGIGGPEPLGFKKGQNNACSLSIEDLINDERFISKRDVSTKIMNEILNSQENSIGIALASTGKKISKEEKKTESSIIGQKSVHESSQSGNSVFVALGSLKDQESNKLSEQISEVNKRIKEFSKHMRGIEEEVNKLEKTILQTQQHNEELRNKEKTWKKEIEEIYSEKARLVNECKLKEESKIRRDNLLASLKTKKEQLSYLKSECEKFCEKNAQLIHQKKTKEEEVGKQFEHKLIELNGKLQALRTIKLSIHESFTNALTDLNQLVETKGMLQEDLTGKLVERAELVAEKEEMDQLYEEIKIKYSKEIEFLYNEMEFRVQIQNKRESLQQKIHEKKKSLAEGEEVDAKLFESNEKIFEANKSKKKLIIASDKTNQEISRDLEEIKALLIKQALEGNITEIIQIHEEAILLYNESFGPLDIFPSSGQREFELAPERKMEHVRQIVFARLHDELRNRMENTEFIKTAEIIENTYLIFIDCLERRIYLNIEKNHELSKLNQLIGETEREVFQLKQKKIELVARNKTIEAEIGKENITLKAIEHQLLDIRTIFDHALSQQIESTFNEYLSQQAATFENIAKTYGSKAVLHIKSEHYNHFAQVMRNNQKKRMEKFKNLKRDIKNAENTIQKNIRYVDETLTKEIRETVIKIQNQREIVENHKKEQLEILESEEEIMRVVEDVEKLSNQRKLEIIQELDGIPNSRDIIEDMDCLMMKKNSVDRECRAIEEQIISIETDFSNMEQRITRISAHQKELEMCLNSLWAGSSHIKIEEMIKKKERLDKEIKDLKRMIDDMQLTKIQLEQKYIEASFNISEEQSKSIVASTKEPNSAKGNQLSSHRPQTAIRQDLGTPKKKTRQQNECKSFIGSHRTKEGNPPRGSSNRKDNQSTENQASLSGKKRRPKTTSRDQKEEAIPINQTQNRAKDNYSLYKDISMVLKYSSIKKPSETGASYKNKLNTLFSVESYKGNNNQSVDKDVFREMIENAITINMQSNGKENPLNKSECSWIRQEGVNDTILVEEKNTKSRHEKENDPVRISKLSRELSRMSQNVIENINAKRENHFLKGYSQGKEKPGNSKESNSFVRASSPFDNNKLISKNVAEVAKNQENKYVRSKILEKKRAKSSEGSTINTRTEKSLISYESQPDSKHFKYYESMINQKVQKYLRSRSQERESAISKSILANGPKRTNYYKIDVNESSLYEIQIFESIKPLLEGRPVYKKFTNTLSLKYESFNPITQKSVNPESLGYGLRFVTLDINQSKLVFMGFNKPTIDITLQIDDILRATTPQITINVIKNQKRVTEKRRLSVSIDGDSILEGNKENGIPKKEVGCYPFHIILKKGGRLEMLACELSHLREWVNSVNTLVQSKKYLPKLKTKLDVQIL